MDWFLYDNGLRHERVKPYFCDIFNYISAFIKAYKFEQKYMFFDYLLLYISNTKIIS